jgi:hypothetical protein
VALIFGLSWGCRASVNADANLSASSSGDARADADLDASGEVEGKGEMSRTGTEPNPSAVSASAGEIPSGRVLLGARHDLKLRPGKGAASCQCLSVALGGSRNDAMQWSAVPPPIDESTQLSIALSSDGQNCKDEPKESLGASYWGYRLSGNDVVVLVEAARGGRPLTTGAVIPKPVGPGQVYVAPASKKLPYGRPMEGKGLCKIGNPGQVRTAPFTELEVGTDAPRGAGSSSGSAESSIDDTPTTIEIPRN